MLKQLFLLVNFVSLFIYQLIFTSDVTLKQNMPSTIQPNGEVEVAITVTKGDVTGFAKIQQEIPEGFVVEAIETQGATFSFKEQKFKLIWMALPQANEFTIKYKLKNVANQEGSYTITGKFSYIAENERTNIDIPKGTITVGDEAVVADNNDDTNGSTNSETENDESETTSTNETTTAATEIAVKRKIEKQVGDVYLVTLDINKTNVEGFAKLSENIPQGFNAKNSNSGGGVFSFENNEVKFLWLSIPTESNFKVSYILEKTFASSGTNEISGTMAYLEGEDTRKYSIAATTFEVAGSEDVVADNSSSLQDKVDEQANENEDDEEITNENEIVENTQETTTDEVEDTNKKVTNTPAPQTGLVAYKVQVGAFRDGITIDKYQKKFNLNEQINLENHEGWTKLITGNFKDYKSARDKRNNLRNKVKTAFVTAYNQGERITVQEALMITNQQWVK